MTYDVKKWNGMPLFLCPECPFDTLDESEMKKHEANHMVPASPEVVQVQVLDRFGNVVENEVIEVVIPADSTQAETKRAVKKTKGDAADGENNAD